MFKIVIFAVNFTSNKNMKKLVFILFFSPLIASAQSVFKKKTELNQKNLELKKNAKKLYDAINNSKYSFSKRAKENGELYGSIKPMELSKAIQQEKKIEIKASQIDLSMEIKKTGSYHANINLHPEVQAKIHIEVVKEEQKN